MPIIPDVDIDGLSSVRQKHDDVNDETERDDDGTNDRTHRDGGGSGPADIDNRQAEAEALDHFLNGRSKRRAEQAIDDEVKADETDADGKAGAQALTESRTEHAAKNRDYDGHNDLAVGRIGRYAHRNYDSWLSVRIR